LLSTVIPGCLILFGWVQFSRWYQMEKSALGPMHKTETAQAIMARGESTIAAMVQGTMARSTQEQMEIRDRVAGTIAAWTLTPTETIAQIPGGISPETLAMWATVDQWAGCTPIIDDIYVLTVTPGGPVTCPGRQRATGVPAGANSVGGVVELPTWAVIGTVTPIP
jgi:hypothetical protein